ncbi:MAG: hypothetical protein QM755_06940 [Luteolibacter sp.]
MGMLGNISENGRMGSLGLVGVISFIFIFGICMAWHFLVADDTTTADGRELRVVLREQDEQIRDLKGKIETTRATVETRKQLNAEADAVASHLREVQDAESSATRTIAGLKTDIQKIEDDLAGYKEMYRAGLWKAAAGEKMATLILKSGRRYENVTIVRVTNQGLEISHQEGLARISPSDLDASWQKRFLWDTSGARN